MEEWVNTTRRLLDQERNEEIQVVQQELSSLSDTENPNVLLQLTLTSYTTALFGRTLLQFAFPSHHLQRPKVHQFTVGDLVRIRLKTCETSSISYPSGIVTRLDDTSISIALGENDVIEEEQLLVQQHSITVDRLVNNATFIKISNALDQLARYENGQAQRVVDVVFSGTLPGWQEPLPSITPFTNGLNESQLRAIQFALGSKDVALIHGPPGTGKTTTVVEFLLQAVSTFHMKVLVCAPSNIAVDNILDKIARMGHPRSLRIIRVGHPARVQDRILSYCLDARIASAHGTEIVADIRKELESMNVQLKKTRDKSERCKIRREMKANRKEIRQREQRVVNELIQHSDLVFCTNVGAATKLLKDTVFDVCVIDEAAQALEASCWIPILKATRCVLAGDHLQLPPTIKSKTAASQGLEATLFDRLTRLPTTRDTIVHMLTTQYRMHEDISSWSSNAMYNGLLVSDPSVATRKLGDLSHVTIRDKYSPLHASLLLIDTAGCDLEEDVDDETNPILKQSKSNAGEAQIVEAHVRTLLESGLRPHEIAIITPYNKQVQVLKARLLPEFPSLEVRSVDGFQGCEKEAVVMSLVRSNKYGHVGFLADDRRMNVAVTRAKRHATVVCDTDTIRKHNFLRNLVEHFEEKGEVRSAYEYTAAETVHGVGDVLRIQASIENHVAKNPDMKETRLKKKVEKIVDTTSKKTDVKQEFQTLEEMDVTKTSRVPKLEENSELEEKAPIVESTPEFIANDTSEIVNNASIQSLAEKNEADEVEEKKSSRFQHLIQDDSSSSSDEGSTVIQSNTLLKELHLSRLLRQPPPAPKSTNKKKKYKKKKNSNVGPMSNGTVAPLVSVTHTNKGKDYENIDEELDFLTRQANQSTRCNFLSSAQVRCKKTATVLGLVCSFCSLLFCYTHAQPEVHGCGAAVKTHAQQQFRSAATSSTKLTLSKEKRQLLQKKLETQINEQISTRKTQGKDKKKK